MMGTVNRFEVNDMRAIRCRELVKTYGGRQPVKAVRGINLEIPVGECFGVLGPNGAGKTTTMEILEGLLEPTTGEVEILGMYWAIHPEKIREKIGISLQETNFPDKLTVRETVTLFRSFYRSGLTVDEAIGQVSLQEKERSFVKDLSGGQKQRLSLAASLVGAPQILFLDEPTTGLDPQSRRQVWDIVNECRANGKTVLLTTHYMEEAEQLCDRVAIVDQGLVIAQGTPQELIGGLGGEHVVEVKIAQATVDTFQRFQNSAITEMDGIVSVVRRGELWRLTANRLHEVLPQLLSWFADQQLTMTHLNTRQASLDDVFLHHTGRGLVADDSAAGNEPAAANEPAAGNDASPADEREASDE
jgi:ABC-2 type transport system ATP-binding protein